MYNQLTELLKCTESEEQFDKEVNSINELIKVSNEILNDQQIKTTSKKCLYFYFFFFRVIYKESKLSTMV